jgi:alpha-tubulin suppressor-like RCC1 family protein
MTARARVRSCVARPLAAVALAACSSAGAPPVTPPVDPPPASSPSASAIDSLVLSTTGSCGVFQDRTARCWGVWEASMIKVASAASALRDVVELRVGHTVKLDPQRYYDHLCARDAHDTVQCWGNNQQRQVGADVSGDAPSPTPLDLSAATQLALGSQHSCALTAAGDVWCWGSNEFGQVGGGKGTAVVPRPRKVALPPIVHLATGSSNTCAATQDERVYCWGQNRNEQSTAAEVGFEPEVWSPREILVAKGTQRIAAGRSTLCGIRSDGTVVCWGFVRALLGDAFAKRSSGDVPGLTGVKRLGLGDKHACALLASGDVSCFGIGERGELGNGEPGPGTAPPTKVPLPGPAIDLAVGPEATCARLQDRQWLCWGANRAGELDANRAPVLRPTPLDLTKVDLSG